MFEKNITNPKSILRQRDLLPRPVTAVCVEILSPSRFGMDPFPSGAMIPGLKSLHLNGIGSPHHHLLMSILLIHHLKLPPFVDDPLY